MKINLKAVEEVPSDNTNDSDKSEANARWRDTNVRMQLKHRPPVGEG